MIQWRELRETLRGNESLKNIRIDVRSVNSGSRRQDQEQMIALARDGIVDRQAALEVLDIPNKYAILQRMNEIEQLKGDLKQALEIIDQKQKQLNTFVNRAQANEGEGNVGQPTSR